MVLVKSPMLLRRCQYVEGKVVGFRHCPLKVVGLHHCPLRVGEGRFHVCVVE